MNTYEIRITNTENTSDLATFEHISDDSEITANEIMSTIDKAIAYDETIKFQDCDRYITIEPAQDVHGYYYTIYESKDAYEKGDESYGGLCTGTLSDAIEMAIN